MTKPRRPSAAVKRMRYTPKTSRLHVEFPGGSRGYYEGVSPDEGTAFRKAGSRGAALPAIKRAHPYRAKRAKAA
jgi:hypothetical protein